MPRYSTTWLIAIGLAGWLTGSSAGRLPAAVPSIMPLGDSITEGLGSNSPGGYRTELYQDLTAAHITFNYVGSSMTNASATLTAAAATNPSLVYHEGHGGYRVDQIANNLDGSDGTQSPSPNNGGYWFPGGNGTGRSAVYPSIILLHIGTNDLVQNYDVGPGAVDLAARLDSLVNQITTDRPNAELFLSSIVPIVSDNTLVMQYNALIQNVIVPKYDALGRHVVFVNQYANFVNSDGSINTSLLAPDGIHPTQEGYNMMGDTWFNAIMAVPEPSSLWLLTLGLVTLAFCRWHHHFRQSLLPALASARQARPRA